MDRSGRSYWEAISAGFRLTAPIAPGTSDLQWYANQAARAAGRTALLLGLTPGIVALSVAHRMTVVALDWSGGMIRHVFRPAKGALAVQGDWREAPLASGSADIAFCDFLFPAAPTRADGRLVLGEAARVLAEGGRFCVRCFLRRDPPEHAEELLAELLAGNAGDATVFRFRLAAALQGADASGVPVSRVYELLRRRAPELPVLARLNAWTQDALNAVERWREAPVRYYFPTLAEVLELSDPWFAPADIAPADYPPYASICRVALRRR
jgi:SAM-dependent methyltransferase